MQKRGELPSDEELETADGAKPIYCPRRRQHDAVCETPDGCAGGADCRLGPDLDQAMNDWPAVSQTTVTAVCPYCGKMRWECHHPLDDEATRWQPIGTAPTDGTMVWTYTAAREGLPAFQGPCAYHPDAGWCSDELREVTHWVPLRAVYLEEPTDAE